MSDGNAALQLSMTNSVRPFEEFRKFVADKYGLSGNALYDAMVRESKAVLVTPRVNSQFTGCFVAGTLVHTSTGLVPIEQIKSGDLVLSRAEDGTGDVACKEVVKTFEFEEKPIWLVSTFFPEEPKGLPFSLGCTGNHPFWVVGKGWTSAENLVGSQDKIRLKDGRDVMVLSSRLMYKTDVGPDVGWGYALFGQRNALTEGINIDFDKYPLSIIGEYVPSAITWGVPLQEEYDEATCFRRRVFNLEVADFHTYFVGEDGLSVHNTNCLDTGLKESGR